MTEPPAEILRRLRPIPTTAGPPTTRPADVVGVRPDGSPCTVDVVGTAAPVLLLFLSAACIGCPDLWEGLSELGAGLAPSVRLAVVTKSPGDEDAAAVAALAGGSAPTPVGVEVVMSTAAFRHYRAAAPFLVVAGPDTVLAESVAWGVDETLRTASAALSAAP